MHKTDPRSRSQSLFARFVYTLFDQMGWTKYKLLPAVSFAPSKQSKLFIWIEFLLQSGVNNTQYAPFTLAVCVRLRLGLCVSVVSLLLSSFPFDRHTIYIYRIFQWFPFALAVFCSLFRPEFRWAIEICSLWYWWIFSPFSREFFVCL